MAIATRKDAFGTNLSGLVYEPARDAATAVLWAVQNQPSKLHRLYWDGTALVSVTTAGWTTGKLLRYPGGAGSPDAEGVTRTDFASSEIYVVAERDNDVPDSSRQSILRYDLGGSKGVMVATHEWLLTGDLPAAEPNHGLEGIAWIPDTYLVQRGFFDEHTQALYDPSAYPAHGNGLFFVSRDDADVIVAYVLDHANSSYIRLAAFSSGQAHSVDLTFDREAGSLWSLCGAACDGRMALLDLDGDPASGTAGRFVLRATVPPPKALATMHSEGIALAPLSDCHGNGRSFFWADDEASDGYAIRAGDVTCCRFY